MQLVERAREPSFLLSMVDVVNMRMAYALYAELCKVDPSRSVLVMPPGGDLRQRVCAADRLQLMKFASDMYGYINRSTVQRQVSTLSGVYLFSHVIVRHGCDFTAQC